MKTHEKYVEVYTDQYVFSVFNSKGVIVFRVLKQ